MSSRVTRSDKPTGVVGSGGPPIYEDTLRADVRDALDRVHKLEIWQAEKKGAEGAQEKWETRFIFALEILLPIIGIETGVILVLLFHPA